MADIFVSYASEDRATVAPLVQELEAEGFSVWWDRRIGMGTSFDREIERELNAASCVVVIWSIASVESDWVREEASDGLERNILVPARIDGCRPPLGFRRAQTADLSGWPAEPSDLSMFLAAVRTAVEATGNASPAYDDADEEEAASGSDKALSVLVLPFTNLSPDPDNEYFADGLTAELITDLSKIGALRVISQTSAMTLKGTNKAIPAIARAVNVRFVLEGSVRRANDAVRITAQLIDAVADAQLWTEKYSGTLEDVFDLQERLSRQIVSGLRVTLTPDEEARLGARPIHNVQAYEHYVRARSDIFSFDRESIERATDELQSAYELLGDNVLILRAMGLALWQTRNAGFNDDPELLDQVEAYAHRIKALDPNDAGSYQLMGIAQWLRSDCPAAVIQLREAYRRDPTDPETMLFLGIASLSAGQMTIAGKVIPEYHRVAPLDHIGALAMSLYRYFEGRVAEALTFQSRGFELDPDISLSQMHAVRTFVHLGEIDKARACASHFDGQNPRPIFMEASDLFVAGLSEKTRNASELSESLRELASQDSEVSQYISDAYAFAGDETKALEWLRVAFGAGFLNHAYLAHHDPFIAPFRDSPAWQDVLERIRIEQQKLEATLDPLD